MNYLQINQCSTTEGDGVRVTLYVSGCTRHCPGCHNPASWNFNAGAKFTQDTIDCIIECLKPKYIAGLTVCGGEPMEPVNRPEVLALLQQVRKILPDKTIWLYTGYEIEELIDPSARAILNLVDVAIVGPYDQTKRDVSSNNLWRGSTNQRIIILK